MGRNGVCMNIPPESWGCRREESSTRDPLSIIIWALAVLQNHVIGLDKMKSTSSDPRLFQERHLST